MVLKQDQERIKTLLKDTITLLCKNGLTFQKEFSLEALIGITLDKDDVFLVSINEIVQSEIKEKSTDEILEDQVRPYVECDGESDGNSSATSTSRKRRKRHRTSKPVRRSSLQDESCDGENSSILSDPEPPEKKSQVKVKTEDVSSDDLVFVKQENEWSQNTPEDTYSNSDTMDLLQHGGAMLEAVPAHAGVDAVPAAAHQRSSSLVRRTATMTTNSGQQENANTQQVPLSQIEWSPLPYPKFNRCVTNSESYSRSQIWNFSKSAETATKNDRCSYCGKSFGSKHHLKRHIATHSTIKPFPCTLCGGKGYSSKEALQRHQRQVHEKTFLHTCGICGKGFMHKGHYECHVRSHTGERVYCSKCGASSTDSYFLKQHNCGLDHC